MPMNVDPHDRAVRDCLVAVVNNDHDLHHVVADGWYRIPVRALGRSISEDALAESSLLALYQTASITAGLPSAIEVCATIVERVVMPRWAILRDQPDHPAANDLYYILRLGAVRRLSAPIVSSRPRRLVFLRTTSQRLYAAADVNDLVIGTPAEERLLTELGGLAQAIDRKCYMRLGEMVVEVDFALYQSGRTVGVICSDSAVTALAHENHTETGAEIPELWSLLRFSPVRINTDLAACAQQIAEAVRALQR